MHEHDLLSITAVKFYRKRDPSLSGNGQLDFDLTGQQPVLFQVWPYPMIENCSCGCHCRFMGSALGLVGPVSACSGSMRRQVWSQLCGRTYTENVPEITASMA